MANRNRTAGIKAELEIARELRDLGFDKVVSTRSESKRLDDLGVDLVQLPHPEVPLPCYIQVKKTLDTPKEALTDVELEKPLVVIHQKVNKRGTRFFTEGQYVIMQKEFFYKLLKDALLNIPGFKSPEDRSA